MLWTVIVDAGHFERTTAQRSAYSCPAHPSATTQTLSEGWSAPESDSAAAPASGSEPESALESLKPLLEGNLAPSCRLFRVLFEHLLVFAAPASAPSGSALLVNELVCSKEHDRSFLATALFVLGSEVDREYCGAFFIFRKLEQAFLASPAEEEAQLPKRIDRFIAQFGGKPCGAKLFEADDQDKARVEAHIAAVDLLAMALTPWRLSLNKAIAVSSLNCVRSLKNIARHFEHFADGEATQEQANREIGDHLLAFARQFSAVSKSLPRP